LPPGGRADPLAATATAVPFQRPKKRSTKQLLWTIAVILFVMWALGLATAYTMGGLIHILLVIAIVVILINVIQGRRAI
jgi:hypothetical protein